MMMPAPQGQQAQRFGDLPVFVCNVQSQVPGNMMMPGMMPFMLPGMIRDAGADFLQCRSQKFWIRFDVMPLPPKAQAADPQADTFLVDSCCMLFVVAHSWRLQTLDKHHPKRLPKQFLLRQGVFKTHNHPQS